MNPWDIFMWIAMVCCSLMLAAVTVTVVVALFKPSPKKGEEVMRGGRR